MNMKNMRMQESNRAQCAACSAHNNQRIELTGYGHNPSWLNFVSPSSDHYFIVCECTSLAFVPSPFDRIRKEKKLDTLYKLLRRKINCVFTCSMFIPQWSKISNALFTLTFESTSQCLTLLLPSVSLSSIVCENKVMAFRCERFNKFNFRNLLILSKWNLYFTQICFSSFCNSIIWQQYYTIAIECVECDLGCILKNGKWHVQFNKNLPNIDFHLSSAFSFLCWFIKICTQDKPPVSVFL